MEIEIRKIGNMWIAYNDTLKTLFQSHKKDDVERFVSVKHNMLTVGLKEKYIPQRTRKYGRTINY